MGFDFSFRTVETRKDLSRLIDFLRRQDLNYPGYQNWVARTEAEIEIGWKTGVIALSNDLIAGDIIWQPHKELKGVREIKNMRIHPSIRGRFLMKQAEAENREDKNYQVLMLDLREDHPERAPLINMLMSMGYKKLCAVNLYDPSIRDIVMTKKVV
jgi:hypothetical protein